MSAFEDLTPEQRRMARQAGAAFADEDITAVDTPFGQQQMTAGLGPQLGECWVNVHTGRIGHVVKLRQGRYAWVTLRADGRLTDIPVGDLGTHWRACRPDGSPR